MVVTCTSKQLAARQTNRHVYSRSVSHRSERLMTAAVLMEDAFLMDLWSS